MYSESIDKPSREVFEQIKILYCTLQEVKKHNATLTSTNSDEISLGRFKDLSKFTIKCCKIFFEKINPKIGTKDYLQDIQQIVEKITPLASDAMFSLLNDETILPVVKRVLLKLNDSHYLSQHCGIHLFSDANGENIPTKSTAIAIGNTDTNISTIHKTCSLSIRTQLNVLMPPIYGVCFSINCLRIMESLSMEDIKDSEFNAVVAPSGGGGGGYSMVAAASPSGRGGISGRGSYGMSSTASIMTIPLPNQISSTIYRGNLPSGGGGGGGGGGASMDTTDNSKKSHTYYVKLCRTNEISVSKLLEKSTTENTQTLKKLLDAKNIKYGGSKHKKTHKRGNRGRGMRNTRR
jgi:hypothetical protein